MSHPALSADARVQTLRSCPALAAVPPGPLGLLAEMMGVESVTAGDTLFEHGEAPERIYVVAAGSLDVFLPGRAAPVRVLEPGQLLGEYGMFAGRVRTATVKARADTVLLSLDTERFRAFLLEFPEATLALLRTAVERLVAAEATGPDAKPGSE